MNPLLPPAPPGASPASSSRDAQALWSVYWQNPHAATARNALMEHYLPLVRHAALRLASRNGRRAQAADIDDLLQYGTFGLKDAIRNFDPSKGAKFETYCATRIRGAMLDGLKLHHWVPRDLRKRIARYTAAQETAIAELGPVPARDAVAERLGIRAEELQELEEGACRMQVGSLQNAVDCGEAPEERLADEREELPVRGLQREDVRALFFRELTRAERQLIMLYYYEERTMREIGRELGISGTRVSQIHTDIVTRLRSRLAARFQDGFGGIRSVMEA